MERAAAAGRAGWLRAAGLLIAAWVPSVGNPGLLVAVPFGLLVLFMPSGGLLGYAIAGAGAAMVAMGDTGSGFWYVERGWVLLLGGSFLALSLRWPNGGFFARGLGAVLGSFLGMGLMFGVRPGDWALVEWLVKSRMEFAMTAFLQIARVRLGSERVTEAFEAQALQAVALQGLVFPALLGLASLSALGLAWWMYTRFAQGRGAGIGPLREFRFNDQLVWVLIMGIVALVATSGAMERIGINAVVFVGALYALRGAAVVLFLTGGVSLLGGALLLIGFVMLAPFIILGAAFIGLGDTWFDLRGRGLSPRPEA